MKLVTIEVLIDQPNPFSWCNAHIGETFKCYWFAPWGVYRVINWKGRWDCTFNKKYQAFKIIS